MPTATSLDFEGNYYAIDLRLDVITDYYSALGDPETPCTAFEAVYLPGGIVAWFDEDGFANERPLNAYVTALLATYAPIRQDYVGTAIFTGGADGNGDTKPLSDEQAADLERRLERVVPVVRAYLDATR